MTTLTITPNWKNKSARFKGTVAAGEHVSVAIQNDNGEGVPFVSDTSTLRLRVVDPCNGMTLAIFPEPEQDEVLPSFEAPEDVDEGSGAESTSVADAWDEDISPLRCTLNLNTVQILKAVPPAANVPLLFVLDDYENKTLYFKEMFSVEHWPRLRGEEEPTDLDNYKDLIAEFDERLTAAEQTVADAATDAQSAANSASAAAGSAATAATAATDAQTGAIASKNAAQSAATAAATSAINASTAASNAAQAASAAESARQAAATSAAAAAESAAAFVVDDTLSVEGAAADAKAVGEANQALTAQIGTVQGNLAAEVTARETLAGAVQVDRQNLANEIARAQGAEQSLDNRKADKAAVATAIQAETSRAQTAEQGLRADVSSAQTAIADRYTKGEVDAKIAGVQTFGKVIVQTLPDLADADDKTIYLVPRADSEAPDLCDEYVVVEESGVRRWERIGAKAVDLTLDDAVTRASANGVKSSGIWSAIWGALTALPTGFASLYDWCVNQLAGKVPTSRTVNGKTLTGNVTLTASDVGALPTTGGMVTGGLTFVGYGDFGVEFKDPDFNAKSKVVALWETPDDGYVFYFYGGTDGRQIVKLFCTQPGSVALAAPNPTAGHLAALDANGNPVDAGIAAGDLARYALVTPTIVNGAATLADRACNAITAAATLTLPAAVSGHARDLIVDVDNSAGASDIGLELASDAAAYLDAGGARYLVAAQDGDDLADLLTVAAGARARLYFTETAQTATPTGGTSAVPVVSVQRLTVTVGGAS